MRAVKSAGVMVLAVGALIGVQAQGASAALTPAQVVLKEDRKKLYEVELEREKDASKFAATEVKEAAKVAAKVAKDTEKALTYRKIAHKIADEILKFGGELTETKLQHLQAMQAADEAKAGAEELAAVQVEAAAAKAAAKRHAILALLAAERVTLEKQIVIDEEAVAAEGL